MNIQIKTIFGKIIIDGDFTSLASALSKNRKNLRSASLSGASLRGAILSGADLRSASLSGASLRGAILSGADLRGAILRDAILSDADLSDADLRGADLRGADLSGADLSGADLSGAPFAVAHLDAKILLAITESEKIGGGLHMGDWHKCETTHCRAGWAVVVAGSVGRTLEWAFGTQGAANLLYAASRPSQKMPNFFASTEDALADIRACAAKDPLPEGDAK